MFDAETAVQWQIRRTMQCMRPYVAEGVTKIRVGSAGDGGYVMLDDFASSRAAYSLGVGGDVSWDLEMAKRGLKVYQYDHTVNGPPKSHPDFVFTKKAIGPSDDEGMVSIASAVAANGHAQSRNLILKIDIEAAEWDAFDTLPDSVLDQFEQIVAEFHGFLRVLEPEWLAKTQRVLGRLHRSHAVYHVHGNNWGEYKIIANVPIVDTLEISYVRRDRVKLTPSNECFPTHLDRPCHPDRPDFILGNFSFI